MRRKVFVLSVTERDGHPHFEWSPPHPEICKGDSEIVMVLANQTLWTAMFTGIHWTPVNLIVRGLEMTETQISFLDVVTPEVLGPYYLLAYAWVNGGTYTPDPVIINEPPTPPPCDPPRRTESKAP